MAKPSTKKEFPIKIYDHLNFRGFSRYLFIFGFCKFFLKF